MTLVKKQLCSCGAGRDADRKMEDPLGNMYFLCEDPKCKQEFLDELEEYQFRATHQGRKRSSYESSFQSIKWCLYIGIATAIFYLISRLFC